MDGVRKNRWAIFSGILECAALCAVMHYCFYCYFSSTTFKFVYDDTFKTITYSVLVSLGLLRLGTGLAADFRRAEDRKARRAVLIKGLLCIAFTVPCVIVTQQFGYMFLVYLPFAAFCLYGTAPEKALKAYVLSIGTVLALTVLCSLSGSIRNLVFIGYRVDAIKIRGSYGNIYPTGIASYLVFLLCAGWAACRKKSLFHTALFVGLSLLAAWVAYVYPWSMTTAACCLLITLVVVYDRLYDTVLSRHRKTKWITKTADVLTVGAFPILAAACAVLTWLFGAGTSLGFRVNGMLSGRLELMWNAFQKYGIQAFGALTPQSGWGGNLVKINEYEFIDSSYALLPIRYGWVIALIAMFLWMWMTRKAIRTGHRRIALAMAVIAFHAFSEHHFTNIHYNFLLVMPLCAFALREAPAGEEAAEKRTLAGRIAGGAAAAAFLLLLPKLLSWARILFERKEWTGGGDSSLPALFAWLACLAGLAALWFALRSLLAGILEKKRVNWRALAAFAVLLIAGAGGALWLNGKIDGYTRKYAKRIEADRPAVELLLEAAEEPVYAGQTEEIYRRAFGGIADRVVSPEELGRTGKGSVLMNLDEEGHQLTFTGALYTEISPYTGLFTYDEAAVEKLTDAGYRFHGYYSAEREEKLTDYAGANKLDVADDGALIVRGKKHYLFAGPYLEQFAGNYRLTYTLRVKNLKLLEKEDREICELMAAAKYGKDIRARRVLYARDFNADGTLTTTLDYWVPDTRGVEFKVRGRDKTEVWVERITWRQREETDVRKTYTKEGRIAGERYYTDEGEPQRQAQGHYGIAYEYEGNNDWTRLTYLDEQGQPMEIEGGYAFIARDYNDRRGLIRERYLDLQGNTVKTVEAGE